jgi:pSer/pThr/pTyr-binding forkhead associated (FHA) protein
MAKQTFQLVMRKGPTPGKKFLLNTSEITIGRESSNDIVVNEAEISRKHARLTIQSGGYVVEDMGSTNGTYVNGQRLIGPHSLRRGEEIALAEVISFSYEIAQLASEAVYPGEEVGKRPESKPAPVTVVEEPREPADSRSKRDVRDEPSFYREPEEDAFIADYGYQEEEPEERGPRPVQTWLLAGCGCFILLVLGLAAIFLVLDQMNQLCNPLIRPVTNIILAIINPILGTTYYCP